MPRSLPLTEEEMRWYKVLKPYINKRKVLNSKPQRYVLDDKLGFHIFTRNYGIRCPRLIGTYYQGEFADCFLDP